MTGYYEEKLLLRNNPELIIVMMTRTGRSFEEIRGFLQVVDDALEEVKKSRLSVQKAKAAGGVGAVQ